MDLDYLKDVYDKYLVILYYKEVRNLRRINVMVCFSFKYGNIDQGAYDCHIENKNRAQREKYTDKKRAEKMR